MITLLLGLLLHGATMCRVTRVGPLIEADCETAVAPGTLFRFGAGEDSVHFQVIKRHRSKLTLLRWDESEKEKTPIAVGDQGVAGSLLFSCQRMKIGIKGLGAGRPDIDTSVAQIVDPVLDAPDLTIETTSGCGSIAVTYDCQALGSRTQKFDSLDSASQRTELTTVLNIARQYTWWKLFNRFSSNWANRRELSALKDESVHPGDRVVADYMAPFKGYLCVIALDFDGVTRVIYPNYSDPVVHLVGGIVYPVTYDRKDSNGIVEKALCQFSLKEGDTDPVSLVAIFSKTPIALSSFAGGLPIGRVVTYRMSRSTSAFEEVQVEPWQIGPGLLDTTLAGTGSTTSPDEIDARDWVVSRYTFRAAK